MGFESSAVGAEDKGVEAQLHVPPEDVRAGAVAAEWDEIGCALVRVVAGQGRAILERDVVAAALARAGALVDAGGRRETFPLAATELVGDLVRALLVERKWSAEDVAEIVQAVSDRVAFPLETTALAVFARALRGQHVVNEPADVALETQLRLFALFAPVAQASIWTRGDGATGPECVLYFGAEPSRGMRVAARRVLEGGPADAGRPGMQIHSLPIVRFGYTEGALVFRTRAADGARALPYARELALPLVLALERRALLARSAARERAAAETAERRLKRIGLDLHDGPMQDILALGSDVRLFRAQLAQALGPRDDLPKLLGRIDDLDARLIALDRELRELARSVESPMVLKAPLADLVRAEVDSLQTRAHIRVDLHVNGSFDPITASQGIALLRIVQEALQNVELHSGARRVHVALDADRHELHVAVADDGHGFDVESTLVRAARAGRLGLVGMGERIRLLGGRFDVESSHAGGTHVSATIPRWTPPERG